ncbi:HPr kinase/phosphorylase [Aestuariispira insulae]|uniref:Hpr(Ser) kinase/phosphatase n=1 Tax=Aestuariispira insulae TaxID=1461337 RepID=A0A3D9HPL6_9PROT|nr:HPr kinase/phosphatase C-terminal domain-containing protein [Aestuariispira insulae]RED51412.1 Hpr(Ser) kinase/phosphatase [Aestuariispira insulae]
MEQTHATTVAINGHAVMLTGPSGTGKSDLALRLIDQGAQLVADDRTCLTVIENRLLASPPHTIAGKMEIRGVGIVEMPHQTALPVRLIAKLVPDHEIERLPEKQNLEFLGVHIPLILVCGFHASTPAKIRIALQQVT